MIEVRVGPGHTPEMVEEALQKAHYDAVCVVHNETSTGVTNPIKAIGEVVHRYDDTLLLVDTVSGFLGAELRVDDWGIDLALTRTQKAFALPPGMALGAGQPARAGPRQRGHESRLLLRLHRAGSAGEEEQHAVDAAGGADVRCR